MATDNPGKCITLPAAADLSGNQYYLVQIDANGRAALCGDNGNAIGVLQNKPSALGQAAEVMTDGVSKFIGSAAMAPGVRVASNAAGKGKAAAALGMVLGVVIENPGADNQTGSMLVQSSYFAAS